MSRVRVVLPQKPMQPGWNDALRNDREVVNFPLEIYSNVRNLRYTMSLDRLLSSRRIGAKLIYGTHMPR